VSNPLFDGQGLEFGHLQREAQRRQNAADAAQQKAQNDQIIGLLKEQKAEQEREKKRLDALPKCPACLSPVEVGSRRCAKCQSAIVSWDNRSFRLICLPEDAGKHLQARIDELSQQVVDWAGEGLRSTTQYADLIKHQIAPPCKVIAAALRKTQPDSVSSVAAVLKCYLNDQPLLDSEQLASTNDAKNLLDAHSQSVAAFDAKSGFSQQQSGCHSAMFFLLGLVSCAMLVVSLIILVFSNLDDGTRNGFLLSSALLLIGLVLSFAMVNRAKRAARRDAELLGNVKTDRDSASHSWEQQITNASVEWRNRFDKAGITPHLDGLKKSVKSVEKSAAVVNDFASRINAATSEITETTQFATANGVGVKEPLPRMGTNIETITPRGLQSQELIEACNRGQFPELQAAYDDAVRLAQSLQLLCKP